MDGNIPREPRTNLRKHWNTQWRSCIKEDDEMRKTILTAMAFLVGCLTIPIAVVVWPFAVAYHVWKIENRNELVRRILGR